MSLIKCIECGTEVSEYANSCPKCGCPINIIKKKHITNEKLFFYNGQTYDISEISILLNQKEEVKAIKLLMDILKISTLDSKLIVDVIKFNNNEIPADYNECLERMREHNSRSHSNNPTIKCPTCGSTKVKRISTTSKVVGATMFGLFSKTARSQFECLDCKYKW